MVQWRARRPTLVRPTTPRFSARRLGLIVAPGDIPLDGDAQASQVVAQRAPRDAEKLRGADLIAARVPHDAREQLTLDDSHQLLVKTGRAGFQSLVDETVDFLESASPVSAVAGASAGD